ncbi:MAG TPA: aminopeptidase P family protein [Candidatus Tumulicola sp.]|jgi:Xaa-Pro aminopeptidase
MIDERTSESTASTAHAGHDPDTPPALVEFMAGGWIERPLAATPHPQSARLRARREALSRAFPGVHIVVPAGRERARANDTFFRYRPGSDFAYLLGGGEPGALLVLEPAGSGHRSILFVREHNRGKAEFFSDRTQGELWVGRHRGVDESVLFYGVDDCRTLSDAPAYLEDLATAGSARVVLRSLDETVDALLEERGDDGELAIGLSEMRLIKDEYELAELRKACAITKRGFEDAIRVMRDGKTEREIEAAFWRRARVEANDVGYLTIAAAGDHACTLHWNRNDGPLRAGALVLLDAGVECDSLYTADVTRTLPVDGTYSPEQAAVYEIVWEAQRAGIEAVAPGNDFLEPNRRAMRVLARGLIELGIAKGSPDELLDPERTFYRRYTLHNVSHMLGIDVHDCARARAREYRYGTLRPGMALTVEPGLYFQPDDATVPERFRGIGVRIEDDLAVTATGAENFSAILPSKLRDVEGWIAELRA